MAPHATNITGSNELQNLNHHSQKIKCKQMFTTRGDHSQAVAMTLPPDRQVALQIIEEIGSNPRGRRRRPRDVVRTQSLMPW
jgi:hypothetical protein